LLKNKKTTETPTQKERENEFMEKTISINKSMPEVVGINSNRIGINRLVSKYPDFR